MPDDVVIRRVTTSAQVAAASALFDNPPQPDATRRFLAETGHHLLVASIGGEAVGMVSGVETTHPDKGTEMFLYELSVAEPYRGRGIATRLVMALAELARRVGCYGMWVLTDDDNAAAQSAYANGGGTRGGSEHVMYTWDF
jgi:GNAT superfamily N-acetyltransferase